MKRTGCFITLQMKQRNPPLHMGHTKRHISSSIKSSACIDRMFLGKSGLVLYLYQSLSPALDSPRDMTTYRVTSIE